MKICIFFHLTSHGNFFSRDLPFTSSRALPWMKTTMRMKRFVREKLFTGFFSTCPSNVLRLRLSMHAMEIAFPFPCDSARKRLTKQQQVTPYVRVSLEESDMLLTSWSDQNRQFSSLMRCKDSHGANWRICNWWFFSSSNSIWCDCVRTHHKACSAL